MHYAVSIVTSI